MLSRVADSLYWMSRYLERAEHTARLVGVGLNQMLDQTPQSAAPRWERMLRALHAPPPASPGDALEVVHRLTFDELNSGSIISCVRLARENARQVREQISSEMWEQLNRLSLGLRGASIEEVWRREPLEFFQSVKEGAHLFQGITDATMSHGEGWYFIQVGRYIERAAASALLLDVYFQPYLRNPGQQHLLDYNDWVGLLKGCTAFEAYCKVYSADVRPDCIAEFLLLNAECPRSLRFAADRIQRGLQAINQAAGAGRAGRADRLAGRLRAALDYAQVDEILNEDMPAYLEHIRNQCTAIHSAIYQTYVSYPVENAIGN